MRASVPIANSKTRKNITLIKQPWTRFSAFGLEILNHFITETMLEELVSFMNERIEATMIYLIL